MAKLSIISCFRSDHYTEFHEHQLIELGRHAEVEIICVCQDQDILNHLKFVIKDIKLVIDDGIGVYPAFNKGLEQVEGKYFCFFNANDKIEVQNIKKVIEVCRYSCFDLLFLNGFYGNHDLSQRYQYIFKKPIKRVTLGMPNVHGATFFSSAVAKNTKFDTRFKTYSDLLHINQILLMNNITYNVINIDWYTLRDGGISSFILSNIREKYLVLQLLRINQIQALIHLARSIFIKLLSNSFGKYWYIIRRKLK